MEILSYQTEGGFIVRRSSSNPGCYALSLKARQGIVHYLIENVQPSGFRIQVRIVTLIASDPVLYCSIALSYTHLHLYNTHLCTPNRLSTYNTLTQHT